MRVTENLEALQGPPALLVWCSYSLISHQSQAGSPYLSEDVFGVVE